MSEWIMHIQSRVYERIKTEFSEEIKTQYTMTDKNFSTVSKSVTTAVFPFVYVHLLPAVETGADLDGTTVNAGLFTFQIDVYDNRFQTRTRAVMGEIVRIMKTMRFQITAMPEIESIEEDEHRATARFQRMIGNGDIL